MIPRLAAIGWLPPSPRMFVPGQCGQGYLRIPMQINVGDRPSTNGPKRTTRCNVRIAFW